MSAVTNELLLTKGRTGRIKANHNIARINNIDGRKQHRIKTVDGVYRLAVISQGRNRMVGAMKDSVAVDDKEFGHNKGIIAQHRKVNGTFAG